MGFEEFRDLERAIESCRRCELRHAGTQRVPGEGSQHAPIMLVGEAPGFQEDKHGVPFIGKSGQRLDQWLSLTGLTREHLFVSNVLKCLSGPSRVRMAEGSSRPIRGLVKDRCRDEVMTVDPRTGQLTTAPIVGWYRTKLAGRKTYKLRYRYGKGNPKGGAGAVLTGDHTVLTMRGFVAVDALRDDDRIATGEPAPGHPDTEQIIYGTMLGDGCVTRQLQLVQSVKQTEWLMHKAGALAMFGGNIALIPQSEAVAFTSRAGAYWRWLRDLFYPGGSKIVPASVVGQLGPLGFAVLYCDDGHLCERKHRRPRASIATNSFSEGEVQAICDRLGVFGVEARPKQDSGWRVKMCVDATPKFAALIAQFVPPSMRYKLPEQFRNAPFRADAYQPKTLTTFWDRAVVKPRLIEEKTVFCIDVAGTHTFVTPGGTVHNCAPIVDVETEHGWKRRLRFPDDTDEPETCMYWLRKQLQLVQPRAVILTGKKALHHVLCAGSTAMAEPFAPWVGRVCRRRDLYGETRFGISWHPAYILRNHNPYDEQKCVDVFQEIYEYVTARQRGDPAPVSELFEVRQATPPQLQRRFRLFKDDATASDCEAEG